MPKIEDLILSFILVRNETLQTLKKKQISIFKKDSYVTAYLLIRYFTVFLRLRSIFKDRFVFQV